MVREAERGEQREVLGVAGREPVAVPRDRRVARTLPVPPVRGGRGALALRRRRRGPPHELRRPAHHVLRNESISDRSCVHAGSSSRSRWLRLESGTRRAPGMSDANIRPCSHGIDSVVARVQHEGRRLHLAGDVLARRCRPTSRAAAPRSSARSCGAAARRTSPTARPSESGMNRDDEEAAEAGVVLSPTEAHHLELHVGLADLLVGLRSREPSLAVRADEDEMAHPLRMPSRVRDRDRAALRQAEDREALEPELVDDGLEVVDHRVEREVDRRRDQRGRCRARRSAPTCGSARGRRASAATPGSASRSRDA